MSQLVEKKVIENTNKMFSVYIHEEGDKSDSSILFGGLDEDAFLDHSETVRM